MEVGLGGRLGVDCICEDCSSQNAEHMSKRPFRVPLAETTARGPGCRQFAAIGDVPQADHALHQPHPRRQLLDALLAPVLRSLDLHHLLARFESDLNRPSPGERRITQLNSAFTSVVNRYLSSNLPSGSRTSSTRIGSNPCTSGQTAWNESTCNLQVTP